MKTSTIVLIAGVAALLAYRARARAQNGSRGALGAPGALSLGSDGVTLARPQLASPAAPLPLAGRVDDRATTQDDALTYSLEAW